MFKNYKLDLYLWFRSSDKHEVNGNNGGFSCIYQDDGWKLDRTNYYQEGWLATGNARGLVGVTFTTSHCRTRATELPLRANYNLRGHRSEVSFISSRSRMYILSFPSLISDLRDRSKRNESAMFTTKCNFIFSVPCFRATRAVNKKRWPF